MHCISLSRLIAFAFCLLSYPFFIAGVLERGVCQEPPPDVDLRFEASVGNSGLSLESAGVAAQTTLSSDALIVVRCNVRNGGDQTAVGYLSGRAVGNLGEDDRRRIEIPPRQIRSYELQVRPPQPLPDNKVDIEVSLFGLKDGKESMVVQGQEPATRIVTIWRPSKNPLLAAVSLGREEPEPLEWRWATAKPFGPYEFAMASRVDAELTKDCISLDAVPFPLNPIDWKNIDLLMLAESNALRNTATVGVLRNYLNSGGRIWVMLDTIDTSEVEPLLEPHQQLQTIDSLHLTKFEVRPKLETVAPKDRIVDLDAPVVFKRVLQQGGTVGHWIDGWPASIVMPVGRGELIVTTLESMAWIYPRKSQWSDDPFFQTAYEMRPWAKPLIDMVHLKRASPLVSLKDSNYPLARIGNPVVPRGIVAAILSTFCMALVGAGVWRMWAGDAKWIGWIAPVLAALASIPLIVLAWSMKRDIPTMVSLLQLVQFESPSGGSLKESAAVYLPELRDMTLQGSASGHAAPDPAISSGIKTVVTNDFQDWQMTNVAWPTGTWRYQSEVSLPGLQFTARGEFTEQGAIVSLPSSLPSELSAPIINYVPGAPVLGTPIESGVSTDDSSAARTRLLVDGAYPAEGQRWTLDTIVGEEQVRRAEIMQKILETTDRLQTVSRTVLGWSELFDQGPQWKESIERRGTALVTMPMTLETPEVGAKILVPYPFIEVKTSSFGVSSPVFIDAIGRWIMQSSNRAETHLEFRLPSEVLPLNLSEIEIDWDLAVPRRDVKLSWIKSGDLSVHDLVSLKEPSIPWKSVLKDPDLLKEFEDGLMIVRLEVSDDREVGSSIPWRIKHLRMNVRGTTLPRHGLVSTKSAVEPTVASPVTPASPASSDTNP
jgi:hypothetical protein